MRTLYSDFEPGNLLHLALARSYERGNFSGVSLEKPLPSGYYFFTAKDIDNKKVQINGIDFPILASDNVEFQGEAVAIVAGEDEKTCQEIACSVKIDFTGDVQIPKYEERGISCISEREEGEESARKAAFESAQKTIENTWNITSTFRASGERTGAICQIARDAVIISTPSEDSELIREAVNSVTSQKVIVNKMPSPIQKSTNALWCEAYCAAVCTAISVITDLNTKIVFTKKEQEFLVDNPLKTLIKTKSAIDSEGKISAFEIEIEADTGFSNPMAFVITDYLANTDFSVYDIPLFKIKAFALSTRAIPAGLNTHMMSAQAFFASENQMDDIAREIAMFPTEIREKNFARAKDEDGEKTKIASIIDAAAKKSDFNRKYAVYKLNALRRVDPAAKKCLPFSTALRGIGIASVTGESYKNRDDESITKAAVVVELEVDPCTFRQKIRALHLIIDCGKIENVNAAIAVLKRDIHQISRSLSADDTIEICETTISFVSSEKKGSHIGEILFNAVPAAYTNALSQILQSKITKFPLSTKDIFCLYEQSKKNASAKEEKKEQNGNNDDTQRA